MLEKFNRLNSHNRFLILLTSIFAVSAFTDLLSFLGLPKWIPRFEITLNGHERFLTDYMINMIHIVLTLIIYILLLKGNQYDLKRYAKAGLVLMITVLFRQVIIEPLFLFSDMEPQAKGTMLSLVSLGFSILYICGIFMFINGSPVDKRLRRFIKWTPFIPILILTPVSMVSYRFPEGVVFYSIISVTIQIFIFMNVYRLAKISAHEA